MDLYFSPMACSLASRISLYEAGARDVQFVEVDPKTKRTMAGTNYFEIYPRAWCRICGWRTAQP